MPRKPFIIGLLLSLAGLLLSGVMRASVNSDPASPPPISMTMSVGQAVLPGSPQPIPSPAPLVPRQRRIQDANWVARQRDGFYTIELYSDLDSDRLKACLGEWLPLYDLASYAVRHEGRTWYRMVYGAFPSLDDARRELEGLPPRLRLLHPTIRRFSQLKPHLKTGAGASAEPKTRKLSVGIEDADVPTHRLNDRENGFAIALLAAETPAELRDYVRRYAIDDAWYARGRDSDWITLLHGHFPTRVEARAEFARLPLKVRSQAWIKQLRPDSMEYFALPADGKNKPQPVVGAIDDAEADWLRAQSRDGFTLFIAQNSKPSALRKLARRLKIAKSARLVPYPGHGWALILGSFSDYLDARTRLDRLPSSDSVASLIVTFGMLQDALDGDAAGYLASANGSMTPSVMK